MTAHDSPSDAVRSVLVGCGQVANLHDDRISTLDVISPSLLGDEAMHTIACTDEGDPHGFAALLANFAGAVRGTDRPLATAQDGRSALVVVEAAYTEAQEQRAISL